MNSEVSLVQIVIFIVALALAISLHETSHALVAYWLGDHTAKSQGRISLNPFNHVDPLTTLAIPLMLLLIGAPPFAAAKPVPIDSTHLKFKEFGLAMVAAAGPLSNLLLAMLGAFLLKTLGLDLSSESIVFTFLLYFVQINVGLAVFNLIPFPPLDGSRILYLILPDSLRQVYAGLERMGFASIALFMFVFYPFMRDFLVRANDFFLKLFI